MSSKIIFHLIKRKRRLLSIFSVGRCSVFLWVTTQKWRKKKTYKKNNSNLKISQVLFFLNKKKQKQCFQFFKAKTPTLFLKKNKIFKKGKKTAFTQKGSIFFYQQTGQHAGLKQMVLFFIGMSTFAPISFKIIIIILFPIISNYMWNLT